MNLHNKYKPLYLSELEYDYPNFIHHLNLNKTFIINGPKNSGKTTIVKLYLSLYNYDFLWIDDYTLNKQNIIEKFKNNSSILSSFYQTKFVIVIDNFDLFETYIKDFIINIRNKFFIIIITTNFLHPKINYIRIHPYSNDYIHNLYCNIYFLEKNHNCNYIPYLDNIKQVYSSLEFYLTYNENNIYNLKWDKFNYTYNDLIKEKKFINKIYMLDYLNSYKIFHLNLVYNIKSIENLSKCYDYISTASTINYKENLILSEYYSIYSMIGSSLNLNEFKIYKHNFNIKKKNNFNY